jgi:hypothetical protein
MTHPKKLKCWHIVEAAMKSGELIRHNKCQRCGIKTNSACAHHADYNKPLEVEWLCKKCHMIEHHGKSAKKDNSTFLKKRQLRFNLLKELDSLPIILETHGGIGKIFLACYSDFLGIVFEKNPKKVSVLAKQRPNWFVYQADCLTALEAGAGSKLGINFLDIDPYGEPWPIIDTFFSCEKYVTQKLCIAVNDGLRQKLKMNGAWSVKSMAAMVKKYGNADMYKNYLHICKEMMKEKAREAGYTVTRWGGYHCGHAQQMTHYAAVLER